MYCIECANAGVRTLANNVVTNKCSYHDRLDGEQLMNSGIPYTVRLKFPHLTKQIIVRGEQMRGFNRNVEE